ncbi:MAG: porin [Luteolibacter sp.]|jgi:phosphate-selective porin OprO/OprP|nr:porin [Luteolibacter sp.]
MKAHCITAALLWLGAGFLEISSAGGTPPPAAAPATGLLLGRLSRDSPHERLVSAPVLYQNDANPWVQQVALVGQLQTQYAYGSDASGNYGTGDLREQYTWGDVEVRRFRLGLKGRLFKKLFFLNLTDLYPDLSPRIYKRIPETYFTWMENDAFNISAGKTELKFNREQEYSSRDFIPFERTALGNMLYGGELVGAWICGKDIAGGWLYYLGAYSNDRQDEMADFDGGAMVLGKIGYNYTAATAFDLAEVKMQWLHNTKPGYAASTDCLASPSYSDSFSLSNEINCGRFGHTAEFLWADGANDRADVCGLSTMNTWAFTKKLQLASVTEFAGSREDNGVILPARYEALSPGLVDKKGDAYFATYAGLNYYIDSHRLKLMSGVKYSHLHGGPDGGDFNGWTWLAGVRMAF